MSEWTATLMPSPSDGVVSSLSAILEEPGSVPHRFFLSRKACAGILRRAAGKGKALPPVLKKAMEQVVASGAAEPEEPEDEGEE
jgi:hypothetical protein